MSQMPPYASQERQKVIKERARVMDGITHLPSAVWAAQRRVPDYSQPVVTSAMCVILTPAETNTHAHSSGHCHPLLSNLITAPQPAACVGRQQQPDWGRCRVSAILNFHKLNLSRTTWYCCSFNKWTSWTKALWIQTSPSLFTKSTVIFITLFSIFLLTQKLDHSAQHHILPRMWRNTDEQTIVMEYTMNSRLCPIKNPWQEQ